jgi:orotidine-5'-phosphate decarboxylase
MCGAAVEGLLAGAQDVGADLVPIVLGVTVLTSEKDVSGELLGARARVAKTAGCGGLVCAGPDLSVVKAAAPGLLCVVPGTRPAGAALDDQARVATPTEALSKGAGLLVIGRVVTGAPDPVLAAQGLLASLEI